jgi:hypothetical protein
MEAMPGRPKEDVEIQIGFSSHTFTTGCTSAEGPHEAYSTATDPRRFCPERYELSMQLTNVVRNLENRKCFYTRRDNYFVAEVSGLPKGYEYWIFFDVRKIATRAVIVWIESAYVGCINNPPSGRKRQKVNFRVLVRKALENTRARRPP